MFDLNQGIAEWRSNLAKSEAMDALAVDELESHLREEIESLASVNLTEEESFWLARRRLGGAGDLSGEFAKINRSAVLKGRLFWMAAGVLAYMLAIQSGAAASGLGVFLAALIGLRGPGLGIVHVTSLMVVLGVVLYICYRVCRNICDSPGFGRWADSTTEKIVLFAALGVLVVLLAAARISAVGVPGFIGAEEYGRVAIVRAYTQLALGLLLPVVMVVAMTVLRRSNSNEAGA